MSQSKMPEWVAEPHARRVITNTLHIEQGEELKWLRERLAAGNIASRKTLHDEHLYTVLDASYWQQERWYDEKLGTRFEIRLLDLMEALAPAKAPAARRRGRPPKHDWDAFWIKAALLANTPDGLPDGPGGQADFERRIAATYDRFDADAPGESQIREKAGKLYQALKAGK